MYRHRSRLILPQRSTTCRSSRLAFPSSSLSKRVWIGSTISSTSDRMVSVVKGIRCKLRTPLSHRHTPSPPLTVQGFPGPPWAQILEAVQQTQQAQQQMQQQMQQLQQEMLAQMQAQTLAAQQAQQQMQQQMQGQVSHHAYLTPPLPNASAPTHLYQTNPLFPLPPHLLLPLQSQLVETRNFVSANTTYVFVAQHNMLAAQDAPLTPLPKTQIGHPANHRPAQIPAGTVAGTCARALTHSLTHPTSAIVY